MNEEHGTSIAADLAEGALRAAWRDTLTAHEKTELEDANRAAIAAGGFHELVQQDNHAAAIGARFELRFRAWKRDLLAGSVC